MVWAISRGVRTAIAGLALLGTAGIQAQPQLQPQPLLEVAPGGRYLQTSEGKPFFYLGDTAWALFHRLTREEAETYLKDRADKGFTVIQAVALAELRGLDEPNAYGELPLVERDPAQPNDAYFAHIDHVVARANALGLTVGLLPSWGRYWRDGGSQIFTAQSARSYGRFLGQRYRDAGVIWILGGDSNVRSANERAIIDAMARGLREGDGGRHLITFHPRGPGLSSVQVRDADWLDFYMNQSSHAARDLDTGLYVEHDRALTPRRPVIDGEPRYEGIPVGFYNEGHDPRLRFDDDDARQAACGQCSRARRGTPMATTMCGRCGPPDAIPRSARTGRGPMRSTIPGRARWDCCAASWKRRISPRSNRGRT